MALLLRRWRPKMQVFNANPFNIKSIINSLAEINMTSFNLKTTPAIIIIYVCALCSANIYAQEVSSLYGITTTKFTDKPSADEYIEVDGTGVIMLNTPTAEKARFEVVRHEELNLFFRMDRARPEMVGKASQARTLARNQEDGFTVSWHKLLDANKLLSIFGSSVKFYSGRYYVFVDTNGDKKVNRVYCISLTDKEGRQSYIVGFAEKEDGSEITAIDAARVHLG